MKIFRNVKYFFIFFSVFCPSINAAVLLHDAETETYLRNITDPLLKAANINPLDVNIFLVQDDAINAFVAEGKNIFVHTGLIQAATYDDVLQGVLAHEIGHIKGSHLLKQTEEVKNIMKGGAMGFITGLAILSATNQLGTRSGIDAIQSGVLATLNVAERNLLSFTRRSEQEADRVALEILQKQNIDVVGLLDLFKTLQNLEMKSLQTMDQYLRTHPLTENRISYIQQFHKSGIKRTRTKELLSIQAKIAAFLENDRSISINGYFLQNEFSREYFNIYQNIKKANFQLALDLVNKLITKDSNDPFLYETRGSIYFSLNRFPEAIEDYRQTLKILKFEKNIALQLATILLLHYDHISDAKIKKVYLQEVSDILFSKLNQVNDPSFKSLIKRQTSIYYYKAGNELYANLYLIDMYLEDNSCNRAKLMLAKTQDKIQNDLLVADKAAKIKIKDLEDMIKKCK